jgi:tRNA (guanine37-N1)-methyltransferase
VDFELSIGDYVLTGGELAAMVVIEAVTRLMPEALGDADAAQHDSFSESLLDFPQYTRPAVYRGVPVPEVLRSGNHQAIAEWRRQQALLATATKRPDLLEARDLSEEEREWLARASSSELAVSSKGKSIQRAGTSKPENERSPAVAASADEAQE